MNVACTPEIQVDVGKSEAKLSILSVGGGGGEVELQHSARWPLASPEGNICFQPEHKLLHVPEVKCQEGTMLVPFSLNVVYFTCIRTLSKTRFCQDSDQGNLSNPGLERRLCHFSSSMVVTLYQKRIFVDIC